MVLQARNSDDTRSLRALEELCQAYWYPLYVYARRVGHSPQDSEDRVQAFLQNVLANQSLESADPSQGKLRAFLKASMRNFMNHQWRHDLAQKRGGTAQHVSIDLAWAESRLGAEPSVGEDPMAEFDRSWAFSVLRRVFARLEKTYDQLGKREIYEAIKGCLKGDGKIEAGEQIAVQLGMSHEGVRSAVFKLRRRFREYIEEEVRETCTDETEFREEIADLCRILTNQE